jgi:hypothetical protein
MLFAYRIADRAHFDLALEIARPAVKRSLPLDQGRLSWHLTAQRPFEAYDQTIRKIFRFLAFGCLLLRSRRAPFR